MHLRTILVLKENGGVFLFLIFSGIFCAEDNRDVILHFCVSFPSN